MNSFRFFDFGNNRDFIIGMCFNQRLQFFDIFWMAHKGKSQPIHFLWYCENGIFFIFCGQCGKWNICIWKIHTLFWTQGTTLDHHYFNLIQTVGFQNLEYKFSIVQKYAFAGVYIFWEFVIIHIDPRFRALEFLSCEKGQLIAGLNNNFFLHHSHAKFRALKVTENGNVHFQFCGKLSDGWNGFLYRVMIRMGKIYPEHVHAFQDHISKGFFAGSWRPQRGHNFCSFLFRHLTDD